VIDLNNRTILITGASSGIGRQCAITCSRLGASLALIGRDSSRLAETRRLLQGDGHCTVEQDLTEYAALGPIVSKVVSAVGPLSGFVHAAGVSLRLPLKLTRPEHFEQALAVNVISAFELTKNVQLKANVALGSVSIVFIASIMSQLGQPAKVTYCASKAALVNGARALALELAPRRIRVNCVSPGVVNTRMYDSLVERLPEDAIENILTAHPLGFGDVNDVANAVAFLLSDAARWITGTEMIVDGGYSAQ
jgi:NAD(P)-dependent dehydrogenase (short-subunit alcohol dehydrogenase family)